MSNENDRMKEFVTMVKNDENIRSTNDVSCGCRVCDYCPFCSNNNNMYKSCNNLSRTELTLLAIKYLNKYEEVKDEIKDDDNQDEFFVLNAENEVVEYIGSKADCIAYYNNTISLNCNRLVILKLYPSIKKNN